MNFFDELISQNSLISIITNIAATALVALFMVLVRKRRSLKPSDNRIESRLIFEGPTIFKETTKERRLRELRANFGTFIFYVFTVYMVYAALVLPLMMKSFVAEDLNLQMARFIGGYLPDYTVTDSIFQPLLLAIAIGLYLPIMWLSILFGNLVGAFLDRYRDLNVKLLRTIWMFFVALFSALLAITVFWLFGADSYTEIAYVFLAVWALLIAFSFSDKR